MNPNRAADGTTGRTTERGHLTVAAGMHDGSHRRAPVASDHVLVDVAASHGPLRLLERDPGNDQAL